MDDEKLIESIDTEIGKYFHISSMGLTTRQLAEKFIARVRAHDAAGKGEGEKRNPKTMTRAGLENLVRIMAADEKRLRQEVERLQKELIELQNIRMKNEITRSLF